RAHPRRHRARGPAARRRASRFAHRPAHPRPMTLRGALTALLLPVSLLAAPGVAARAAAQSPPQWKSTVTASVIVAPPPILLTTTRDLYFGNVSPGQVVAVPARPAYPVGTWAAGARFGNLAKTVRYGVRF